MIGCVLAEVPHEKLTVCVPRGPGHYALALDGAPGRVVPALVEVKAEL